MATKQKTIAVIDCETDPFDGVIIPEPFLWGFYDGTHYEEFTSTVDLIAYICGLDDYIVYAHNGGKFDYHFILDFIEDFSTVMIINGRLSKFKIGRCEFRDSYNILPVSLKKMQKDEFDYNKMRRENRRKYMAEIKRYLYHDCIYLYRYVNLFIEQYGLHLTQAGAALKTWQKMTGLIAPNDVGGIVYDEFSPYYYGGRCEAFVTGEVTHAVKLYDINSAYPFAMLNKHPFGLAWKTISKKKFDALTENERGACFLTVHCLSRGAFPCRGDDNSLYFPDDGQEREYRVTGWEYTAAIDTNTARRLRVDEIRMFADLLSFEDYVNYFYTLRQEAKAAGDNATDLFAKIFLNSLYGKWGANPRHYQKSMIVPPESICDGGDVITPTRGVDIETGKGSGWHFAGQLGDRYLAQAPLDEPAQRFYNVATAASITGYVRAMLLRAKIQAVDVVYCDTDSLFCRDAPALNVGAGLGAWKHEADYTGGYIAGKKLYAFRDANGGEKIASKGARLDFASIAEIAAGGEVTYNPEAPSFSVHHAPRHVPRVIRKQNKRFVQTDAKPTKPAKPGK